jgi:hypothetical protein
MVSTGFMGHHSPCILSRSLSRTLSLPPYLPTSLPPYLTPYLPPYLPPSLSESELCLTVLLYGKTST